MVANVPKQLRRVRRLERRPEPHRRHSICSDNCEAVRHEVVDIAPVVSNPNRERLVVHRMDPQHDGKRLVVVDDRVGRGVNWKPDSRVFVFSGLERVLDDSIANGATFAEGSVGFLATHVLREKCRFDGHRTYYYGGHVDEKRQQQHECSRQQHQNSSPRRRRHHDHEDDDFTTGKGCEVIDSICEAGVGVGERHSDTKK